MMSQKFFNGLKLHVKVVSFIAMMVAFLFLVFTLADMYIGIGLGYGPKELLASVGLLIYSWLVSVVVRWWINIVARFDKE